MAEVTTKELRGLRKAALFFNTAPRPTYDACASRRRAVRTYVLTLALLLSASTLSAQTNTHDSIYNSLHGRISLAGGLDSRNSFISNRKAQIWGIKAAAEFGELVQLGIGYNRLSDDIERTIYFVNSAAENDSAIATLKMDYWSWYARYVFYRKGRWKFSIIPFQLGIGRSRYRYEVTSERYHVYKSPIIVYETGFSVSFRVCRWLGVGGDVGIRYLVKKNPYMTDKFNSPQYAFYMIIYWTEILRTVAPKNKFVKML